MRDLVHATAVARRGACGWRGALLRGPSGAGKSDLALRLTGEGWRLVGDDYVHLFASGKALWAVPAPTLAGRIEARGLGIVAAPALSLCRIVLAVDLIAEAPERLPEPAAVTLAGLDLPQLRLDPRPASAPRIVAAAIDRL